MDNTGSRELITRGNLDGIISAAVFLRRFPRSPVRFVTSPAAAADALRAAGAEAVYLADLSPTTGLVQTVDGYEGEVTVVDHHPSPARGGRVIIDTEVSAAALLYRVLEGKGMDDVVALADLYERCATPLLDAARARLGHERLRREAEVLDFAWRCNVEDDLFRVRAAADLSSGALPSCHPLIAERHRAMVRRGGWDKALGTVKEEMRLHGRVGVLELRGRRRSFHGFGSRALAEVARREGCDYAVMISHGPNGAAVSLRSAGGEGDLGRFAQDFTRRHGVEGGGHPTSAGARVPSPAVPALLDELSVLA